MRAQLTPKRILLVGYFNRKGLFESYYNTESKLANGFIRAGHHVICFSDRDHAREATIWGSQKFGKAKMAAKLIETAKHYRPHLVLFGHADLIEPSVYDELRNAVKDVKLATFCVDAVFRDKTMASFKTRAAKTDKAFITTGDSTALKALGVEAGKLHYFPNPVDSSIETARIFEKPLKELKYDGQFLGTGIVQREAQITYIEEHLPADYRFTHGGRAFGSKRLTSTEFIERLTDAAVSLNLPLDDRDPVLMPYLYSSDRIAQLLGQGVTTISPLSSKLSDLYDDGILEYSERSEIVSHMLDLHHDDEKRRDIGRRGHEIAHSRTNTERVAEYILATSLGEKTPEIFWPGESY